MQLGTRMQQEAGRQENTRNMNEALAVLDRFFTLFFLVTSIIIIPTTMSLITAGSSNSTDTAGLLRGILWSSIVGSILLVVAIYGIAVLLRYHWLRIAGIYGVICIFAEAWLMLITWLSTSPQYWTIFDDPLIVPIKNFLSLFVAILLYYAWQKRSDIKIGKIEYFAGIVTSFNLFLAFSFLGNYATISYLGGLSLELPGIVCLLFAEMLILPLSITFKNTNNYLKKYLKPFSSIALILSEIIATSILLLPFQSLLFEQFNWLLMIFFFGAIIIGFILLIEFTDNNLKNLEKRLMGFGTSLNKTKKVGNKKIGGKS